MGTCSPGGEAGVDSKAGAGLSAGVVVETAAVVSVLGSPGDRVSSASSVRELSCASVSSSNAGGGVGGEKGGVAGVAGVGGALKSDKFPLTSSKEGGGVSYRGGELLRSGTVSARRSLLGGTLGAETPFCVGFGLLGLVITVADRRDRRGGILGVLGDPWRPAATDLVRPRVNPTESTRVRTSSRMDQI